MAKVAIAGPDALSGARLREVSERLRLAPEQVMDALESLGRALPAGADEPASALTPAQEAVLREAGSLQHALPPLESRASTRTAFTAAHELADALTVAEAATLARVTESRVRQRLTAGTLLGIETSAGWRLPRWQFPGGREIRGLDRVLLALGRGTHPLVVRYFLTAPSDELELRGEATSPQDWLTTGGSIDAVIELAVELGRMP